MNTTPTPAQILSNKVVAAIRLADVVGRSRGINGFAVNENAVRQLVDMETEILDALAQPALAAPVLPVSGLGWSVRERRNTDGSVKDCFVSAPTANGMAYGLEVLGDDYTGYGDQEQKLMHCHMIVAWANAQVMQPVEASPETCREWRDEQNQPGVPRQVNDAGGIRSGVCVGQVMQPVEASHPKNAAEIRGFIGSNFDAEKRANCNSDDFSEHDRAEPSDNDRYTVSAHDLLSSFREWVEVAAPVAPTSPHPEFDRGFSKGWDRATTRAALTAAKPEPLSDAQINEAWGRYDEGVETQRDVFERILALQAGGAEA